MREDWQGRSGSWVLNLGGQDDHDLVGISHDRVGPVVGAGDMVLPPVWRLFTIGNPGSDGLVSKPHKVRVESSDACLILHYGNETCRVTLELLNDQELRLLFEATALSGAPVEGHLMLVPTLGETIQMTTGDVIPLGEPPFAWTVPHPGGGIEHHGWRLFLPPSIRLIWPVSQEGSHIQKARLGAILPFSEAVLKHELRLFII